MVENAIQNTALRVVLPSVSHERMTCMVEQHVCDHTTTARDVIVGLCQQANSLPVKECGEYALFVPAVYAKRCAFRHEVSCINHFYSRESAENGYFLEDKRHVLSYALDGVILELRLKPWKITVELCEKILSSRKTALSMKELKEHLEKLLAKRLEDSQGSGISSSPCVSARHAISLSSSSLARPPEIISEMLQNQKKLSQSTGTLDKHHRIYENNFGETAVEVDPHVTCGSLVSLVLRKFHGNKSYVHELEDFGFFLPNMKEKLMGESSNVRQHEPGTWLDPTEKIITYGHRITQVCNRTP